MADSGLPEPKTGNSKVQGQFRNLCFTAWVEHYTRDELEAKLRERCEYYVFSIEKAPSTGRFHYQGYAELKNRTAASVCYKWLPRVCMQARKGTQKEAIEYCKKVDTHVEGPYEYGTMSTQGTSGGLRAATDMIAGGSGLRDVAIAHPEYYVRHVRGLTEYSHLITATSVRERPHVTYIYGPPGSGKTTHAIDRLFEGDYDQVTFHDGRFVGYYGNENVLLDDFDGTIPRQMILTMLDRVRCTIRTVGSTAVFRPKKVVITSNFSPDSFERYSPKAAFIRRLDIILNKPDLISDFIDVTASY